MLCLLNNVTRHLPHTLPARHRIHAVIHPQDNMKLASPLHLLEEKNTLRVGKGAQNLNLYHSVTEAIMVYQAFF